MLSNHPRNMGMPFDRRRSRDAGEPQRRRAPPATLPARRTVKKDWQAAWLLQAIGLIDLTTLAGDDTPGRVERLCAKARQPVREDLLEALGMETPPATGAVCVYHALVATAVEALRGHRHPGRRGLHRLSRRA